MKWTVDSDRHNGKMIIECGQWNTEDRSLLSCSIYSYPYGNNILTITTCFNHEFTNVDTSLMCTLWQSPNGVHISEVLLYFYLRCLSRDITITVSVFTCIQGRPPPDLPTRKGNFNSYIISICRIHISLNVSMDLSAKKV